MPSILWRGRSRVTFRGGGRHPCCTWVVYPAQQHQGEGVCRVCSPIRNHWAWGSLGKTGCWLLRQKDNARRGGVCDICIAPCSSSRPQNLRVIKRARTNAGVSLGTGRGRPAAGQCVLPLTRLRAHVPGQQADRRLCRRECVDGKCVACEGILADRFECMPHSQKWGFLFDLAELAAPCRETPCNQLPCITFISLRPARRDVGIDAPEEFGGAEP